VAEFFYRIEHRPSKKHGNADGLSRRPDGGCKQCLGIEKRDEGPWQSNLETLDDKRVEYSWDHCQLKPAAGEDKKAAQALRLVLAGNVTELSKLQENLPGVVTDVYRAKKEGPVKNS